MKIDDSILHALRQAVENCGGAKELAAKCQVSASNISVNSDKGNYEL